jgi:hypothetical protein
MKDEIFLDIIEHHMINPLFVKANIFLINKFKQQFDNTLEKENLLKSLWVKEFRAELLEDKNSFNKIIFKSKLDLSIFMIKFSSY